MSTAPRTTKTTAKPANDSSTGQIGDNPLALLAGGVALGMVIGALLPRLARERKLLDPIGRTLADRATSTVQAVKETGRQEIDALLPAKDDAKERVSALFGTVIDAAKSAARG